MYCIIAWGKARIGILDPIVKSQKRAIRLICSLRKFDSTSSYFKELKIMRVQDLYTYSVNIFMYKFTNNDLPSIFDSYFTFNQAYHNHETRQKYFFRPPLMKTWHGNNFIRKQGAQIWNLTIKNVQWNGLIGSFKSCIRKNILNDY